jgi:hypothetical protein
MMMMMIFNSHHHAGLPERTVYPRHFPQERIVSTAAVRSGEGAFYTSHRRGNVLNVFPKYPEH